MTCRVTITFEELEEVDVTTWSSVKIETLEGQGERIAGVLAEGSRDFVTNMCRLAADGFEESEHQGDEGSEAQELTE